MNKYLAMGRLTKDVELRKTEGGTSIVRFTVAIPRVRKVEGQPDADFIPCVAFGRKAEVIAEYFHKGDGIQVVGRMQTASYEKENRTIYTYTCVVDEFFFLYNKKNADSQEAVAPVVNETPIQEVQDVDALMSQYM